MNSVQVVMEKRNWWLIDFVLQKEMFYAVDKTWYTITFCYSKEYGIIAS